MKDKLSKLLDLSRRVGYLYPSFQIYNGMKGMYDYGPLGTKLKRNLLNSWLDYQNYKLPYQISELDSSILVKPSVLAASGHLTNFSDDLTDCLLTKGRYRRDKLEGVKLGKYKGYDVIKVKLLDKAEVGRVQKELERLVEGIKYLVVGTDIVLFLRSTFDPSLPSTLHFVPPPKQLATQLDEPSQEQGQGQGQGQVSFEYLGYASPTNSPFMTLSRPFNLMLKTSIDSIDPTDTTISQTLDLQKVNPDLTFDEIKRQVSNQLDASTAYLRPETCQGVFVNYQNLLTYHKLKLPFATLQVGKSFRNEISCEHVVFRTLEFEQMELELFVAKAQAETEFDRLVELRYNWWKGLLNHPTHLRLFQQPKSQLAHYASRCTDVEYSFPWGYGELEGVANRTNYDLIQHSQATDKSVPSATVDHLPHVIETSAGLNRAFLAVLLDALTVELEPNGTERFVLKLKPSLAPIKVAIIPLLDNPKLNQLAIQLEQKFKANKVECTLLDSKLKVGKKYYRMDSIGTPFCITIDFDSESNNQVTVRHRDTKVQELVGLDQVVPWIQQRAQE